MLRAWALAGNVHCRADDHLLCMCCTEMNESTSPATPRNLHNKQLATQAEDNCNKHRGAGDTKPRETYIEEAP